MAQPRIVKPPPTKVSCDSYSWEDALKDWQAKKLERRHQIQIRLGWIPELQKNDTPFLSLPFEIREKIIEYSVEWKDLVCMSHRGRSFHAEESHLKKKLDEMPFWFVDCPTVLALNRQILCEVVTVLMRRRLIIAPLREGVMPKNDEWANPTIVWPMARLWKMYEMASWGGRLHLTPKLVLEAPDVLAGFLWAPLREILMMWREGMIYEQMRIEIRHGTGDILGSVASNATAKRTSVVVEEKFLDTLVVRSLQWASQADILEKKSEYSGPIKLKSLEHSLQVPIAMSRCMPAKSLKVQMLTSHGR